ncbi:MAG TPA: peptidase MA family metallohydrolase, partial [Dehalococcoidales bacterium]|nr:peptidase MA family metallohydrolase [Dehalococcoidales bacterium]
WAGGEELSQYNCILLMVRPEALSSDLPGVAHELTHVIVGQITFNPYNSIPFWLNEGLAVHIQFPQGNVPSAFTTALSNAIANNSFISVRSLSDPFSAVTNKAYLSYAESVSIVTYLINQYGAAKMNQLLDTFQQGTTYDVALKTIYGFDMDGLFTQWKTWVNTENGKQPIY